MDMAVLSELEPSLVFRYFEEICGIPHGSGNTKQISDYCVRFAKEHGLRYIQDSKNNVILFKDGTPGYEQSQPVMIQGHLDMVCERTQDCKVDFEKDGLTLCVEDGMIRAQGTTLGGDDGIAVAYALAILDSKDISHPPLEVVLTVDEEIGMLGAEALDCTPLRSRAMLNIDSEEEGILLVSCAGGVVVTCHLPVKRETVTGVLTKVTVGGLSGGHSGMEIIKGRANANRLLGRLLNEMSREVSYALLSVNGGLKDNAIPREASAELVVNETNRAALEDVVRKYQEIFQAEFKVTDPELFVSISFGENQKHEAMTPESAKAVIAGLVNFPGGVQRMSTDIPGLVQTSLNLGILNTVQDEVQFDFSVRSSVGTEKEAVINRLANLTELLGGTIECQGNYPAWEYKRESKLRSLMVEVFEDLYGRKPAVEAVHAGLECGLFAGKLPGLDCVSLGPDIRDIHTTGERMDIASVERTWKYILEVLKRLK